MLAMPISPLFSAFVEEMGTNQETFLHFPAPHSQSTLSELDRRDQDSSPNSVMDPKALKKLNHNASERCRRKRINHMFSYLRSQLPILSYNHTEKDSFLVTRFVCQISSFTDTAPASLLLGLLQQGAKYLVLGWMRRETTKKMSIPAILTHVLKYIPELQQSVERLVRRKEQLLCRISRQQHVHDDLHLRHSNYLSSVSASRLGNDEVVVQISTYNNPNNINNYNYRVSMCSILLVLEQNGLLLINASSFQSSGGRLFYNLHLKVGETCRLECELLSKKLLALFM